MRKLRFREANNVLRVTQVTRDNTRLYVSMQIPLWLLRTACNHHAVSLLMFVELSFCPTMNGGIPLERHHCHNAGAC
jgi:hypothetical protein